MILLFIYLLLWSKPHTTRDVILDLLVVIFGPLLSLYLLSGFYDYGVGRLPRSATDLGYTPISFEYALTIAVLTLVATIGFLLLRFKRENLPPIPKCLCLTALLMGILLCIVYLIQLTALHNPNVANPNRALAQVLRLFAYPINFILCSIKLVWHCVLEELDRLKQSDVKGKVIVGCQRFLTTGKTWLIVFILIFPLFIITLIVLVLMGQSPDAAIRAFAQTSDWTFSAHSWPLPRIDQGGHYLCTVALRGSEKVVKPLRFGIRRGERIIVNRQLCVANAFEQYIMEKAPKFHKTIRGIYDLYGYPISKHISTKKQADVVYFLMKPLEWIFVFFLYMVEKNPENRIASQYLEIEK